MSAVRFRPPAPPAGLRGRPLYRRLPPPGHPGAEPQPDSRIRRTEEPAETGRWCSVRAVGGWSADTGLRASWSRWASSPSGSRSAFSSPAKPPAPSPLIVGLEAERPPPGRRSEDVRTPAEHRPERTAGPSGLRCRQIPGTTAEGGVARRLVVPVDGPGSRRGSGPGSRRTPAATGRSASGVGSQFAARGAGVPFGLPGAPTPGPGRPAAGGTNGRDYRAGLPRNYREGEEASAVSVICPRSAR